MIILFLDDGRMPEDVTWIEYPINAEFKVVRNSKEFIEAYEELTNQGLEYSISLDHDIQEVTSNGREVTGYDVLKMVVNLYFSDELAYLPNTVYVHTQNPVGRKNILSYWYNFCTSIQRATEVRPSTEPQPNNLENTIYAIEVSYGDGCTYKAEKLEFFSTNKQELERLCEDFNSDNCDPEFSFSVVVINPLKTISERDVIEFKKYWNL